MDLVLSDKCLADFIKLIHELTGITIASNRNSMVEGRLRKRVSAIGLPNYEGYLKLVKDDRSEQVHFVNLVTTNETYFYRTPRIWDYIENKFLPEWIVSHPKSVFSAWSAASSSGEEAHTLGIICQAFKEKNPSFIYQITGTDISKEMVGLCQQGKYAGRSIESFKKSRPELFDTYMSKCDGDSYEVIPKIKSRLRFHQHNLFQSLQLHDSYHLVLIRNVLIYFKGPDQEKVISLIGPKMAGDGVMIIGESETLTHINTNFKSVEPLIYRQKSADCGNESS
jgi:chemotaxis protein methyltransferase CheR